MTVSYSKKFIKQSKKLDPILRTKLQICINLFSENPFHPSLRNHTLGGRFKDYRSIDIMGDLRALYCSQEEKIVFAKISTHSQLYG